MTKDEAHYLERKYAYLIEIIDGKKRSLTNYDLTSSSSNTYFSGADLSYLPMQTLDQATSKIIVRINTFRKKLDDYKKELDTIRRIAEDKRHYYAQLQREHENIGGK